MSQKLPGPEIRYNLTTRYLVDIKCIHRTTEQQTTAELFNLIRFLFNKALVMWKKYPAISWKQIRYLQNCVDQFNQQSSLAESWCIDDNLLKKISKMALKKRYQTDKPNLTDQEIQHLIVHHFYSPR